ncbi:putative Transmembrane protein [Mycena indigotica]|uniref:Putative Transmembrane protein n=1 Tax=Mycena indigotica TaxID=2126181 RepID=A0A8H6S686_9AGAR|nr:putative Transmembrane protein [Mycena indigotica]KAF7292841.1 putative Transmembrane protein [Mycena indigotica]
MVSSKANVFRIISFTLAGGDVLQTIPPTYQLYKRQWKNRTLSPVCFFYAAARYLTIISLVSNAYGFYGTHYTLETCKPWYMLPNVTAMLAGMAVQVLLYIRTYAISGRSPWVKWGLGAFLLLGFPVQVFGIVFRREARVKGGDCKGVVLRKGDPDWNIVYYSAHMAYDFVVCAVATFFIVYTSRLHGMFLMSKFIRKVLRNGLLYAVVVFIANLWVVLEFVKVLDTGVGATLPLAVVLIAAQHLILSTQRLSDDQPSTTDEHGHSHPSSGPRSRGGAPGGGYGYPRSPRAYTNSSTVVSRSDSGRNTARQDVEMQPGVFVFTETYDTKDPVDSPGQTTYTRDNKVNFGIGV